MSKKYRTITRTAPYQAEIYDNCYSYLQSNGRRFRVVVQGTKWTGNTGGYYEYTRYLDRAAGRALLRKCRQAKAAELRGGEDFGYYNPDRTLSGVLSSVIS